jgi:hypothetical protein
MSQKGFSLIIIFLIIAIVLVLGVLGFFLYLKNLKVGDIITPVPPGTMVIPGNGTVWDARPAKVATSSQTNNTTSSENIPDILSWSDVRKLVEQCKIDSFIGHVNTDRIQAFHVRDDKKGNWKSISDPPMRTEVNSAVQVVSSTCGAVSFGEYTE